jgi:hypothetical protein
MGDAGNRNRRGECRNAKQSSHSVPPSIRAAHGLDPAGSLSTHLQYAD